jgi:hypothetical protein
MCATSQIGAVGEWSIYDPDGTPYYHPDRPDDAQGDGLEDVSFELFLWKNGERWKDWDPSTDAEGHWDLRT